MAKPSPSITCVSQRNGLIITAMTKLEEMFSKRMTPLLMETYSEGLADLSLEELREVFSQALRECKFMPTLAELRGFIARCQDSDQRLQCDGAWAALVRYCYDHSCVCQGGLEMDAPAAYAVKTVGGWAGICKVLCNYSEAIAKDSHFLAKSFKEAYLRYVRTNAFTRSEYESLPGPKQEEAKQLLGQVKQIAAKKGF